LKQTAIVNPHVQIIYTNPKAEQIIFPRATEELPKETCEIKPHPYGVELGRLISMLKLTDTRTLQAFLTQEIWIDISKITNEETRFELKNIVNSIWKNNYTITLENMKNSIDNITKLSKNIVNKICIIGLDICKSKIDSAIALGLNCSSTNNLYKKAGQQIKDEKYELGFDNIIKSFIKCDKIINGHTINNEKNLIQSKNANIPLITSIIFLIVGIILIFIGLKQKR